MSTEALLEQVLGQPDAPLFAQKLAKRLDDERLIREKFYNDIDESMKIEFINGEIIMHSPVRKMHNEAIGFLYKMLDTFVDKHDLGFIGFEKIMVAFTRNDYEPDIVFFNKEKAATFTEDQTLFPVPDFIVEVLSKGTASKGRGIKKTDYAIHGVQEYWLVDPITKTVEQFLLNGNEYELKLKSSEGNIRSKVIENFSIPIAAIFDRLTNRKTMQQLISA